ncbi:hypothetical protein ACMYM3_22645, partial [Salmonella enterica subsp. enterica serovar Brandenburg]|uniref:hypothetical protein n=1 Tax=Salmonella enterica TaxID=28901 RepID=UPI0039E81E68
RSVRSRASEHPSNDLPFHDTAFQQPLPRMVTDQVVPFSHELADFVKELGHGLIPHSPGG